jgi:hypothetical protein
MAMFYRRKSAQSADVFMSGAGGSLWMGGGMALDALDMLFVVWAFFFQIVLIAHFAVRKLIMSSKFHGGNRLSRW